MPAVVDERGQPDVDSSAGRRKAADKRCDIGDDWTGVDVVAAGRRPDGQLITRNANAGVPVEDLVRRRERRAARRVRDLGGGRSRRGGRWEVERPASAAREVGEVRAALVHAPDGSDADERPEVIVGRLRAGPTVADAV